MNWQAKEDGYFGTYFLLELKTAKYILSRFRQNFWVLDVGQIRVATIESKDTPFDKSIAAIIKELENKNLIYQRQLKYNQDQLNNIQEDLKCVNQNT